jgi:RHS repeat-associated protein
VPGPPVQFGPPIEPAKVKAGEGFTGIGLPENDIFYFHPDHLGSTSYITTKNGSISQHVEYIAFGEVLFEEHSSSFSSPYLFNGKELDRETNLSYYGARYLDMKTSLWISVDPLAEQTMSSYGYCYNYPVNLIDPTGMEGENVTPSDEYVFREDGTFKEKIVKPGEDYIRVEGSNKKIEFSDPVNDPKAIDNGDITNLVFVSNKAITNVLSKSGVYVKKNQDNKYTFVQNESSVSNIEGSGKMDYVTHYLDLMTNRDLKKSKGLYVFTPSVLFVNGNVAHNNNNFGNFLWGAGASALGIPCFVARAGAHYNNYFLDPNNKGKLDSDDDQFSIQLGHAWQTWQTYNALKR